MHKALPKKTQKLSVLFSSNYASWWWWSLRFLSVIGYQVSFLFGLCLHYPSNFSNSCHYLHTITTTIWHSPPPNWKYIGKVEGLFEMPPLVSWILVFPLPVGGTEKAWETKGKCGIMQDLRTYFHDRKKLSLSALIYNFHAFWHVWICALSLLLNLFFKRIYVYTESESYQKLWMLRKTFFHLTVFH